MDSLQVRSIRELTSNPFLLPPDLTIEEFFYNRSKDLRPPGFEQLSETLESLAEAVKETQEISKGPKELQISNATNPGLLDEPEPQSFQTEAKEVPAQHMKEEDPAPVKIVELPPAAEEEESKSPSQSFKDKTQPSKKPEDVEWVTVKSRSKKKPEFEGIQSSPAKFETLAEQQLSSNKNKKKAVKKKLKEIKELIKKQSEGLKLNPHQLQKVQNKESLEKELLSLT